MVVRGATHNVRGQPLAPVFPPEYFADMVMNHRKQLEQSLPGSCWRLESELPALDKGTVGQKVSSDVCHTQFEGDMWTYFKARLKGREGELLGIDGKWMYECEMNSNQFPIPGGQ